MLLNYSLFKNRFGETSFHIGRECVISYGIAFSVIPDSILTRKFSDVIAHMNEGGLITKKIGDALDKVCMGDPSPIF
jgi:hypothetical protein